MGIASDKHKPELDRLRIKFRRLVRNLCKINEMNIERFFRYSFSYDLKKIAILFAVVFFSGCQFLSVKGFQCANNEWPTIRSHYSLPVYYGMSQDKLRKMFSDYEYNPAVTLDEQKELLFIKYRNCPIRKYVFENDKLIRAGELYFEGYWFYFYTKLHCCPVNRKTIQSRGQTP